MTTLSSEERRKKLEEELRKIEEEAEKRKAEREARRKAREAEAEAEEEALRKKREERRKQREKEREERDRQYQEELERKRKEREEKRKERQKKLDELLSPRGITSPRKVDDEAKNAGTAEDENKREKEEKDMLDEVEKRKIEREREREERRKREEEEEKERERKKEERRKQREQERLEAEKEKEREKEEREKARLDRQRKREEREKEERERLEKEKEEKERKRKEKEEKRERKRKEEEEEKKRQEEEREKEEREKKEREEEKRKKEEEEARKREEEEEKEKKEREKEEQRKKEEEEARKREEEEEREKKEREEEEEREKKKREEEEEREKKEREEEEQRKKEEEEARKREEEEEREKKEREEEEEREKKEREEKEEREKKEREEEEQRKKEEEEARKRKEEEEEQRKKEEEEARQREEEEEEREKKEREKREREEEEERRKKEKEEARKIEEEEERKRKEKEEEEKRKKEEEEARKREEEEEREKEEREKREREEEEQKKEEVKEKEEREKREREEKEREEKEREEKEREEKKEREKEEEEARKKKDEEEREKEERERKEQEEKEEKEAQRKHRAEKEEAERVAAEAERLREEQEQKAREDAELKAREEAEGKRRQEEEEEERKKLEKESAVVEEARKKSDEAKAEREREEAELERESQHEANAEAAEEAKEKKKVKEKGKEKHGKEKEKREKPIWKECHSHKTGKTYYYNRLTKKSVWTKPQEMVDEEKEREAEDKNVDDMGERKHDTDDVEKEKTADAKKSVGEEKTVVEDSAQDGQKDIEKEKEQQLEEEKKKKAEEREKEEERQRQREEAEKRRKAEEEAQRQREKEIEEERAKAAMEKKRAAAARTPSPLNAVKQAGLVKAKSSPSRFGGAPKCYVCAKSVYAAEKVTISDAVCFHKQCFKCGQGIEGEGCGKSLTLSNYGVLAGIYYCKPHYKQTLAARGGDYGSSSPVTPASTPVSTPSSSLKGSTSSMRAESPAATPPTRAASSRPLVGPKRAKRTNIRAPTLRRPISERKTLTLTSVDSSATDEADDAVDIGAALDEALAAAAAKREENKKATGSSSRRPVGGVSLFKGTSPGEMANMAMAAKLKRAGSAGGSGRSPQNRRNINTWGPTSPEFMAEALANEAKFANLSPRSRTRARNAARVVSEKKEDSRSYRSAASRKMVKKHENVLITCRGKRRVHVRSTEVDVKSMYDKYSYVLDCDRVVYVYNGKKSSMVVKHKAKALAEIIRSNERGGGAVVIELGLARDKEDQFWKTVKGTAADVSAISGTRDEDEEVKKEWLSKDKVYRLDGSVEEQTVTVEKLMMEVLKEDGVFCLDFGTEFYIWVGKEADEEEREVAEERGKALFSTREREDWVKITTVHQGAEAYLFREKFANWPDQSHDVSLKWSKRTPTTARHTIQADTYVQDESVRKTKIEESLNRKFDAKEMVAGKKETEEGAQTGVTPEELEFARKAGLDSVQIWQLKGVEVEESPVKKEQKGHFVDSNCYLIQYTYNKLFTDSTLSFSQGGETRETESVASVIFYWQGGRCKLIERGAVGEAAKKKYVTVSKGGTQCRTEQVQQGRESELFLSLFDSQYVVHLGDADEKQPRLYHIRGNGKDWGNEVHAIEVLCRSSELNSGSCFVCLDGSWVGSVGLEKKDSDAPKAALWIGKGCSAKLKEKARLLAKRVTTGEREAQEMTEGDSGAVADFWKVKVGNKQYCNSEYLTQNESSSALRLFRMLDTGKSILAEEVERFSARTLYGEGGSSKHIALLDCGAKRPLFLWFGGMSDSIHQKRFAEITLEYLKELNDGRDGKNAFVEHERRESQLFRAWFHAWSTSVSNWNEPKEEAESVNVSDWLAELTKTYSHSELAVDASKLPRGVDAGSREFFLHDEEFKKVFGMDKESYKGLPKWKALTLKKKANLF